MNPLDLYFIDPPKWTNGQPGLMCDAGFSNPPAVGAVPRSAAPA